MIIVYKYEEMNDSKYKRQIFQTLNKLPVTLWATTWPKKLCYVSYVCIASSVLRVAKFA